MKKIQLGIWGLMGVLGLGTYGSVRYISRVLTCSILD